MAEPLNATFFAFKKRERTGVLTGASVAYFVCALVLLVGFLALNYQALGGVISWYGQLISAAAKGQTTAPDISTLPAGIGTFFLTLFPFIFFVYVLLAAYEAACLRWMIRGESEGFMGLSLGADTWRVYGAYWVWFLLYMGFTIVFTILTLVVGGAAVMSGGDSGNAAATAGIGVLLITCVRLVLMIFFAVRLAPAAATSVGLKRFSFFKAWAVTRGRFWALFGAFLLLLLIVIVGEIVFFGVMFTVIGASIVPQIVALGPKADPAETMNIIATMFTPQNMIAIGIAYAILIALSLIVYVLFFGINARAVQAALQEGKVQAVST